MSLTDLFRRRAMARELARCAGMPIPAILNDKDA